MKNEAQTEPEKPNHGQDQNLHRPPPPPEVTPPPRSTQSRFPRLDGPGGSDPGQAPLKDLKPECVQVIPQNCRFKNQQQPVWAK